MIVYGEPGTEEMSVEREVSAIEDALDALLNAAIEADSKRAPSPFSGPRPFSMKDVMAGLQRSPAARKAEALIAHPVGRAVRNAIEVLGERLNELGGQTLMGDVCQRVADRDPGHWDRRTDIMDKRWDGIGGWAA